MYIETRIAVATATVFARSDPFFVFFVLENKKRSVRYSARSCTARLIICRSVRQRQRRMRAIDEHRVRPERSLDSRQQSFLYPSSPRDVIPFLTKKEKLWVPVDTVYPREPPLEVVGDVACSRGPGIANSPCGVNGSWHPIHLRLRKSTSQSTSSLH